MTPGGSVRDIAGIVRRWQRVRSMPAGVPREDQAVAILERLRDRIAPGYPMGEVGKIWPAKAGVWRNAERRFFLGQIAGLASSVAGDTVEAGVYEGATSRIICETLGRRHHGFDSFEGLSTPDTSDGVYWTGGDLSTGMDAARQALAPFDAELHKGWIPEVFEGVEIGRLAFGHIDVDLYQPTLGALERFYPLMEPGGILVLDDHGFATCPGARQAAEEFMSARPEPIIEVPTGQAFIVRRAH